jgi:hypothetical protein
VFEERHVRADRRHVGRVREGRELVAEVAPPITAPATIATSAPTEAPMPMSTTPMVPAEPQEVPVSVENTAVTTKARA